MHTILIKHIGALVHATETPKPLRGKELKNLPIIHDAFIVIENEQIADYGSMNNMLPIYEKCSEVIDARGKIVMPGWCDSHTHIVFAGSREKEFRYKLQGLSYAEIAAKGGGIVNSALKLRDTSENELFLSAWKRLKEVNQLGTSSIEIKSGYGLSFESELTMLRVIKKLKEKSASNIKATFLGAHAIPPEYQQRREDYISLIINTMIPQIAEEKLADFIDVFCEHGFFTPEETKKICLAGKDYGLIPKIHANQLNISGGVQVGHEIKAISVDHLETVGQEEIDLMGTSDTTATLLPNPSLYLHMAFAPARKLIEANALVALASDYNPGSSPSGNMNLVVSLACMQMRMLPEEAFSAATINGAHAMQLADTCGSITVGKRADLILFKQVPSIDFIPYAFGTNLIERVMINGSWIS